jgi:hypothetical protein
VVCRIDFRSNSNFKYPKQIAVW